MSATEKYGSRDLSYSSWHRAKSIARFVDGVLATKIAMIDVDAILYCEYDNKTREPLVLIETSIYKKGRWKACSVITKLAERANLPALNVLYELSDQVNPCSNSQRDIEWFHVKRVNPYSGKGFVTLSPEEYINKLIALREWSLNRVKKGSH